MHVRMILRQGGCCQVAVVGRGLVKKCVNEIRRRPCLWLSPFPATVDDLHTQLRRGAARRVVAVRFSAGRLESFYQPIVLSWFQLMPVGGTWAGVQ